MARPPRYKGYSSVDRDGVDTSLYDVELVKADLRNALGIRIGEVRGRPDEGCLIWDFLADPFDDITENAVVEEVERVIGLDPRVKLLSMEADISREKKAIAVTAELLFVELGRQEFFDMVFEA